MGFGLFRDAASLAALPVVACGAAKDLYGADSLATIRRILAGASLSIYDAVTPGPDPIAEVMVAGKVSVGRFGGALRRLLYSARSLTSADVRAAQCLTEQVTQKALSVKGGKSPLSYRDFERQLVRLLRGEMWSEQAPPELVEVLTPLRAVWEALRQRFGGEPNPLFRWLRQPHELDRLLSSPALVLRGSLTDLRLRGFV